MRTNKPHWQSSGIIIFLWKYYIVISDTLVGFFFDVLFLLLAVLLSELYEKPRRKKDWVTEKSTKKNLRERHQFFWLHTLSTKSFFVAFFVYSPSQVTYLLYDHNKNTKYFYGWYSVWYGKYEKTSWLASLRKWSYFKLFFSNSYSGYELKLIIKRRIKLLFAFTVFTKVLI